MSTNNDKSEARAAAVFNHNSLHPFLIEIITMTQAELLEQPALLQQLQAYVLEKIPRCPAGPSPELRTALEGMRYLHRQRLKLSTQQMSLELRRQQILKQIGFSDSK